MAKLNAAKRNSLPGKDFALPGRRYPINDPGHARNALARVSGNGSPAEKAKVRAAVHHKYPNMGKAEGGHKAEHSAHPSREKKTMHKSDGKFMNHSAIGSHPGYTMSHSKRK